MTLRAQYYKHTLNFRFEAGTSRGVLNSKDSYFIKMFDKSLPEIYGIGEAGPLFGLSEEFGNVAETKLQNIVNQINNNDYDLNQISEIINNLDQYSSIKFALETAVLDLKNGGKKMIFENDFYLNHKKININGLVWMSTKENMKKQIFEKIEAGFDTIKLKIGAINFKDELELLKNLRNEYSGNEISLRLDANGAFDPAEALEKLKQLSEFNIHSIEQPIKPNQIEAMANLCKYSPIDIALDEELIGNQDFKLLEKIKPQYIILKPTLMGGLSGAKNWIKAANDLHINWWITSALESNIGLNAICQFTAEFDNIFPQGLGTGQIYQNNFESPLTIDTGKIYYDASKAWVYPVDSFH